MPSAFGPRIGATVHPACVLRAEDASAREAAYAGLVEDLRQIAADAAKGETTGRRKAAG